MKHFIAFLFVFFTVLSASAQISPTPPRLVVGIMIDGLQQRHIEQLWYRFENSGFRKIVGLGTQLTNVRYNSIANGLASDAASVMTGSTPYYNGVTGDLFYNKKKNQIESILKDDYQFGVNTNHKFSAHFLLSSSFTDELVLEKSGRSKVFSVGIHPEAAIMMGGHKPSSAVWINESGSGWASSAYYESGLPSQAQDMVNQGMFKLISTMKWTPKQPVSNYLVNLNQDLTKKVDFKYDLSDLKGDRYQTVLRKSPAANALVIELAKRIVASEKLGLDADPDVLMLELTVRTPDEKAFTLHNMEKEDLYLRLDQELQSLMDQLEKEVGKDRVLVFVYGNQTNTHLPMELGNRNIPSGYFNANSSMALLSTYLMALYGPEKWISGYYGKNIYLNKDKLVDKKINIFEFQQVVADFMMEFEGVQAAYTYQQLLQSGDDLNAETSRLRNSINKKNAGDILFTLMPGWLELDDSFKVVGEMSEMISFTPVYFYGWRTQIDRVHSPYQILDLAPTISTILNIPFPNANLGKPMTEVIK